MGKASIKSLLNNKLVDDSKTAALVNLTADLCAYGYQHEAILKILGGNFLRVWLATEAAKGDLEQSKPNNGIAFMVLETNKATGLWQLWDNRASFHPLANSNEISTSQTSRS